MTNDVKMVYAVRLGTDVKAVCWNEEDALIIAEMIDSGCEVVGVPVVQVRR